MRNLLICIFSLWVTILISQNKQLIYGMEEIPQSLLLNPGSKVPQKKHLGILFLSQIHVNVGSSGVSPYDIFGTDNGEINAKITEKIFEMKNSDFFTSTQQLDILDFGWRAKNEIYFSGGLYQELDFILYFPRDLAILGWEGNANYLDYEFDLGDLNTNGDLLTVYHFGANKQISTKLTVGLRAKLYSSMFSYRSTDNSGTFVTRLGDGTTNIYEHTIENANVKVETSGLASLQDLDGSSEVVSEILGRAFFGGNIGIGMDLGATYDISDNISISGSLLDLGAIFHTKDVETYEATGSYTLNGIEFLFPPLSDGEPTYPYYDELEDAFEAAIPIDTLYNSYTQMRPIKANASVAYKFGKIIGKGAACDCRNMSGGLDLNQSVGFQLYSIFRPKGPQTAATLFYYRRLTDAVSMKGTYTVDSYSATNLGLGMSADIGKFNFYMTADNLIRYGNLAKAKSLSLQLGFNIKIDEE